MKPTILNERYRLVDLVGAGGMATVYRGEDLLLERPVAVKFLREPHASDPEARAGFVEEARAAAKLDHPNIVHVYDVGEDEGGRPFIVMEIVDGEDLKALIRRDAPLSVARALAITRQICAGVGVAHRNEIVHCDLKPHNILVTEAGTAKVTDFGIAQALRQEEMEDETTPGSNGKEKRAEVVWGSPHYLSPEQARGHTPTPASDVYSIGVVLYEMLTGVPPFHDQDPTVLAMKHLREEPTPLSALNPRVPSGLDWLVRKILSKEPSARYRNADQLRMAIDEYVRRGQEGTSSFAPIAEETPVVPTREPARVPPELAVASSRSGSDIAEHDATSGGVRRRTTVAPAVLAPTAGADEDDPASDVDGTQPVPTQERADTTLWALILVATIAVVGLIPLWLFVYRAYNATPVVPTRALSETEVVPTPGAEELVTVPNLMGLSVADAERMAESLGLQMEVAREEETADARPGAVLEQTPGPGHRVATDATVSVVLAAGRPLILPDIIGYDLDVILEGLESEGLMVELVEVRSTQPRGTVLEQTPSPDTQIRAGDTITLTVSGGSNIAIPLDVNLNDQVILEQAWVSQFDYAPGGNVPVTLRWRVLDSFGSSYKVFIHILTLDETQAIAQQDVEPVNGMRPTTSWSPGDVISDPHQVPLPEGVSPGTYQIRVGLYNDQGRLPVTDAGETQVSNDTIFVTTFEVRN